MALSKITNLSITDDTIVNADVNSSAAIALSKLATDPSNASNLASGTVPTARLGSGTASSTTILYGDQTYKTEPAGGLTGADQWRLTTSFTGDANPIASNWEQVDTSGAGFIGSAMTESSGIFTFPSTGIWLVSFKFYGSATTAQLYCSSSIETTINDSSYVPASYGDSAFYGGTSYISALIQYLVDVTDVANVKVKFRIDAVSTSTTTLGSSTNTQTGVTFIRLGDT